MKARIDSAKTSGCDAIQLADYDFQSLGYSVTGINLTKDLQLNYFKYLAGYAQSVGLSVSLVNNRA